MIHAHKPDVTICSNWMYSMRHPDDVVAPIDYISGDFTWIWSVSDAEVEARFMSNRGTGWELMAWGFTNHGKGMGEWVFKTVPALCQEAAVVLACGGAFLVYDSPERSCRIIPWHMDALGRVADFCRARKDWHGGESVPQAAILHSAKAYYEKSIPLYNLGDGAQPVEGALAAILENGYDADILNDNDFYAKMGDYPVSLIPAASGVPKQKIASLGDYVENGGVLVLSGLDETDVFDELLGIKNTGGGAGEEIADYWQNDNKRPQVHMLLEDGICILAHGQWRLVELVDAVGTRTLAPLFLGRDPAVGMVTGQPVYPGVVWRQVGKGAVIGFLGPFMKTYSYTRYPGFRNLLQYALQTAGADKALCRVEGGKQIHISCMEKGGDLLIHLYNTGSATPNTPKSAYIEDVPRVFGIKVNLPIDAKPKKVYLAPDSDPISWTYRDGILNVSIESLHIYEILVVEQ